MDDSKKNLTKAAWSVGSHNESRAGRMALVLGLLLLGAAAAEAQTPRILVSNSAQCPDDSADTSGNDHAQLFHTGGATNGYTLTSVRVNSEDAEDDAFDVEICEEDGTANEFPSTTASDCTALTAPGDFTLALPEFTHASIALSANTNYVVVIKERSIANVELNSTTSAGEDTSIGLSDWSIKNYFYWNNSDTWTNQGGQNEALRIIVNGYEGVPVVGDTTPPALASATVVAGGDEIALVFDELVSLSAALALPPSALSVTVDGSPTSFTRYELTGGGFVDFTQINIHGLSPDITHGQTVINNLPPPPPAVTSVELVPYSTPTSGIGVEVETLVFFSAAVDVTGTPKAAACWAATNTTTMACGYTVVVGDSAPNGIAIAANKLTLNGGTITATGSTTITADLAHAAVAIDAGQKVDGIRPTLVTSGSESPVTSTDGTQVILTFSEDIGGVSRNDITIEANSVTAATSAASVTGPKVELTLTTALTNTATNLTAALAADAVFDTVSNGNLALAATAVTNAINNAPEFTEGTSTTRSVAENTASGQNIGAPVMATDADTSDTLTYTLGGPAAAAFGIVSASGQLQTSAPLDSETKVSYAVTVSVSDGNGGADSINVTINVTADRAALVALYNATGGADWTKNTNWLSNEALSEWHRVETDEDGRVTALRLNDNELSGEIPAELGNLTRLSHLALWGNPDLERIVPAAVGVAVDRAALVLKGSN